MEQGLKEANAAFTVAAALMGPEVLEEALLCPRRSVSLGVTRNIMSVNVPVFTFQTDGGDDALLPYGFAQTSGELDAALEKMQAVFADMLELAQVEKTMQLLAQDIEKTRRRVNALEYVMIPETEQEHPVYHHEAGRERARQHHTADEGQGDGIAGRAPLPAVMRTKSTAEGGAFCLPCRTPCAMMVKTRKRERISCERDVLRWCCAC